MTTAVLKSPKMMSRFVKISDVMNACVTLSQSTGSTVKKVQKSGSLNIQQKGVCKMDICTEADLIIQKTLSHNLKALFPQARVICEEDETEIHESVKPTLQPD
jgi:3'-phosphoadenosine 5'-phosphosulfate (PAPS) 3'-phosphatase